MSTSCCRRRLSVHRPEAPPLRPPEHIRINMCITCEDDAGHILLCPHISLLPTGEPCHVEGRATPHASGIESAFCGGGAAVRACMWGDCLSLQGIGHERRILRTRRNTLPSGPMLGEFNRDIPLTATTAVIGNLEPRTRHYLPCLPHQPTLSPLLVRT